jgi:hypothetical protein
VASGREPFNSTFRMWSIACVLGEIVTSKPDPPLICRVPLAGDGWSTEQAGGAQPGDRAPAGYRPVAAASGLALHVDAPSKLTPEHALLPVVSGRGLHRPAEFLSRVRWDPRLTGNTVLFGLPVHEPADDTELQPVLGVRLPGPAVAGLERQSGKLITCVCRRRPKASTPSSPRKFWLQPARERLAYPLFRPTSQRLHSSLSRRPTSGESIAEEMESSGDALSLRRRNIPDLNIARLRNAHGGVRSGNGPRLYVVKRDG